MAFRTECTAQADADLEEIFDLPVRSRVQFGNPVDKAIGPARTRSSQMQRDMNAPAKIPRQGILRPEFGPGVRDVTKDRAISCFAVDDGAQVVRIFPIFYGGQDHPARMRKRRP